MQFGPKTTEAINRALPGFNGVLAKQIPTERRGAIKDITAALDGVLGKVRGIPASRNPSTWTDRQLLNRVTDDARRGIYDITICSALAARQMTDDDLLDRVTFESLRNCFMSPCVREYNRRQALKKQVARTRRKPSKVITGLKRAGTVLLNLARGIPSQRHLSTWTDNQLLAQVRFDSKRGVHETYYWAELMRRQMGERELLDRINHDAEDGRINTEYSREYDRRRALK